jgi:hypothetical protein
MNRLLAKIPFGRIAFFALLALVFAVNFGVLDLPL